MSVELELKSTILRLYKTVREFASVNNISPSTINNVLIRGVEGASLATMYKICKALGISLYGLMEGKVTFLKNDNESAYTLGEMDLISIYNQLDDRGRHTIDANLKTELDYITTQADKKPKYHVAARNGDTSGLQEIIELYENSIKKETLE